MDEYERLKLRMQCLELAKQVSLASLDLYSVERRAEEYWQWVIKQDPPPTQIPAKTNTDDDIPF